MSPPAAVHEIGNDFVDDTVLRCLGIAARCGCCFRRGRRGGLGTSPAPRPGVVGPGREPPLAKKTIFLFVRALFHAMGFLLLT